MNYLPFSFVNSSSESSNKLYFDKSPPSESSSLSSCSAVIGGFFTSIGGGGGKRTFGGLSERFLFSLRCSEWLFFSFCGDFSLFARLSFSRARERSLECDRVFRLCFLFLLRDRDLLFLDFDNDLLFLDLDRDREREEHDEFDLSRRLWCLDEEQSLFLFFLFFFRRPNSSNSDSELDSRFLYSTTPLSLKPPP